MELLVGKIKESLPNYSHTTLHNLWFSVNFSGLVLASDQYSDSHVIKIR